MFAEIAMYLIKIASTLFGAALLLRAWALAVRLPPNNPFSQAIFQATHWLVRPLRRVIPGTRGIDWASVVAAYLTALAAIVLTVMVQGASPLAAFPFGLIAAVVTILNWLLTLVLWMTVLLGVLSWINPRTEAMWVLQLLTAPLLNPIRRRMPATGGIDFSPLILIIIVQILSMVLERCQWALFSI